MSWFSGMQDLKLDHNFFVISVDRWQSLIFPKSAYDDIHEEQLVIVTTHNMHIVKKGVKTTSMTTFLAQKISIVWIGKGNKKNINKYHLEFFF